MLNCNLVIANDHAGFNLKLSILNYLQQKNLFNRIINVGSDSLENVDYPDYAKKAIEKISKGNAGVGILICGSGIGMSIAANRNSFIRAALCLNEIMAEKAREHNNANILVLGSKLIDENMALKIVEIFLNTKFKGGRHKSRINKIS